MFKRFPHPEALPPSSTVFLTFTNGHYSELMLNSLATIAALGRPAFVYCFDDAAVQLCKEYGIPYFQAPPDRMMATADFRQDAAKFLEMGVHKPEIVLRLFQGMRPVAEPATTTLSSCSLQCHRMDSLCQPHSLSGTCAEFEVEQVILTDTDTVWMRDPVPYLAHHPNAHIFTLSLIHISEPTRPY